MAASCLRSLYLERDFNLPPQPPPLDEDLWNIRCELEILSLYMGIAFARRAVVNYHVLRYIARALIPPDGHCGVTERIPLHL